MHDRAYSPKAAPDPYAVTALAGVINVRNRVAAGLKPPMPRAA